MAAVQQFKDKSFGMAFWLVAALFTCGAWWGESVCLDPTVRAILIAVAGLIPLSIQLITGYGLDSGWVARFSKSEQPKHYWGSLAAASALALALGFGAYYFLVAAAPGVAT